MVPASAFHGVFALRRTLILFSHKVSSIKKTDWPFFCGFVMHWVGKIYN